MLQLQIQIAIDPALYIRNPKATELGRKILSNSIEMIDELGFESFTFRKLGARIESNESSIYRYFESLISWYWSWIEYRLVFATTNITDPETNLKTAIQLLTEDITEDTSISFVNEILLNNIIIAESSKAYHTKDIDKENAKGYYKTYKRVVERVSNIVLEITPAYEFPHMLISTVIEGAHHQRYFSQHLPSLTDVEIGQNSIVNFYTDLVFSTIKQS